ncbi:DUF4878 domain-containing protein [Indibacter alkaliphilus]|uniref:DUF4878 domain-containing protein n=1 Tax=Indibacter alkaliphilus TaxID=579922 RepID=UPI000282446E|nr:DUF4878 domain-containing protein [Indibacter alkaliphilus]
MKNLLQLSSLLVLLLFVSCNSNPKSVAQNFAENLAKGNTEKAKKYATEATGSMIDMALKMGLSEHITPDFTYKAYKDSIVNNKAWVKLRDPKNPDAQIQVIYLIKVDGKWLVQM